MSTGNNPIQLKREKMDGKATTTINVNKQIAPANISFNGVPGIGMAVIFFTLISGKLLLHYNQFTTFVGDFTISYFDIPEICGRCYVYDDRCVACIDSRRRLVYTSRCRHFSNVSSEV